ncbi:DUF309 domain-containing protein [Rhodococcus ruber]|uniref:DUF309 domain-containing protein n=1 Tax=Rhodococcus ruber TaxID=1830 RepID=A0ABT4M9B9_9NOCA|nr:DUF309 domain-containing protein [Rhodococcus ruber]MCZ4517538.1 DUF309 domain-containing protein [Rhodococcus ruber]
MTERERDARGKPLNARPRDGLGRPLARGGSGTPRVPDDVRLPPDAALVESQKFLDANMPFHAHEVLEGTWKSCPTDERPLWQGLAQLAVGLTHLLRGNRIGAASLLRQGHDRLVGFEADPPHSVDVSGLLAWSEGLLDDLETGTLPVSPGIPVLRATDPRRGVLAPDSGSS